MLCTRLQLSILLHCIVSVDNNYSLHPSSHCRQAQGGCWGIWRYFPRLCLGYVLLLVLSTDLGSSVLKLYSSHLHLCTAFMNVDGSPALFIQLWVSWNCEEAIFCYRSHTSFNVDHVEARHWSVGSCMFSFVINSTCISESGLLCSIAERWIAESGSSVSYSWLKYSQAVQW